jgi:hypothetical protein
MKQLLISLLLVTAIWSPTTLAATASGHSIEDVVGQLSDAYAARDLGRLDAEHVRLGRVTIRIENSLGEDTDPDRFVTKSFRSFAAAEKWLRSREHGPNADDGPARSVRPLKRCRKGLCTYDFDGGILHNNLYLQKVSYSLSRGKAYIKTIYLLDGD